MKDIIFNEYYDKIYYWSLGKTKNIENARDLTNDIFVEIYTYLNKGIKIEKIDSLIWTIAFNTWKNKVRNIYKDKVLIFDEEKINTISVEDKNIDQIIYKDILNNLSKYNLTEKEKKVFNFYYRDDLSVKEISYLLNISDSSVKYYLFNGRNKVKENYND